MMLAIETTVNYFLRVDQQPSERDRPGGYPGNVGTLVLL